MKKIISFFLIAIFSFSLTSCSQEKKPKGRYMPGDYSVTITGYQKSPFTVIVHTTENEITSIQIAEKTEQTVYAKDQIRAVEIAFLQANTPILTEESTPDITAGVTETIDAYKMAVAIAVNNALVKKVTLPFDIPEELAGEDEQESEQSMAEDGSSTSTAESSETSSNESDGSTEESNESAEESTESSEESLSDEMQQLLDELDKELGKETSKFI